MIADVEIHLLLGSVEHFQGKTTAVQVRFVQGAVMEEVTGTDDGAIVFGCVLTYLDKGTEGRSEETIPQRMGCVREGIPIGKVMVAADKQPTNPLSFGRPCA
jgi:hypothetical protein